MFLLIRRQTDLFPSLNADRILTPPLKTLLQHEAVSGDPEISILLSDEHYIQELNHHYRGLNKPTDVLSFAQDDPRVLGDIVIALPVADRQAQAACWPLENELVLLAVHGLLHLLGEDDETELGAAQMQRKTELALQASGITLPATGAHPFLI